MKSFIFVILFITSAIAEHEEVLVGDYSESGEEHLGFMRITGGTKAKPRIVPSYVALQIYYDHGTKTCGGFLGPAANQVVTAANCVFE